MTESDHTTWPAARGAALALAAAVLFGVSTPLVQRFGRDVGAFTTAALLYAGAAIVGAMMRRSNNREAPVGRHDIPRLLAIAVAGAVVGPVALAWGLQRTSATSASLMLTLEALFTAVLAWLFYRESMGRRVWMAMTLLSLGGIALILDQSRDSGARMLGLLAVLLATIAWGMDNTLSRELAQRDPGQIVSAKAFLGAVATSLLAAGFREHLPSLGMALALLLVGATGYGLSLRLYLLAQRSLGAARTGSVFAFAPFIGAVVALAMGDHAVSGLLVVGGACMVVGVVLHITESHGHQHFHDALEHEHAHVHDDGHHEHVHLPMPDGPHSHLHRHEPRRHAHSHVPDTHHTHRH